MKKPVFESKASNLKRPQQFLRAPILKNICERLLLERADFRNLQAIASRSLKFVRFHKIYEPEK